MVLRIVHVIASDSTRLFMLGQINRRLFTSNHLDHLHHRHG